MLIKKKKKTKILNLIKIILYKNAVIKIGVAIL